MKKCKYPKCNKEVYKNHALFCLQHSRELKENGKTAVEVVGSVLTLLATAGQFINRKK